MLFLKLALTSLETAAIYLLATLVYRLIRPLFSPLRALPSPPSPSLLYGNVNEVRRSGPQLDHWYQKYGKVMRCRGFLGLNLLFTIDTTALNHILTHSFVYQKAPESRFFISSLLGNGILVTEAEKHKQQRRIMNTSFSASSIRDLTPLFFEKALRMRDAWEMELLSETGNGDEMHGIEVLSWLSRTTLDIIGLAGFHHEFDSLNSHQESEPGSLNQAIRTLLRSSDRPGLITLLQATFPIFRIIPDKRSLAVRKARHTMLQLGQELLVARQQGGILEKGRDLLSVLVRANTDAALPHSQRMNNEDVLTQIPTFLVAGHETTSNQTAWVLFALAQRPDLQARLRDELRSVPSETPSADDLSPERLPFLEMVVRETLRLNSAVTSIVRFSMRDDVIPVEQPYVDQYGRMRQEIRINKGESIIIPILALNRAKHIWGDDATEFNPDRWANPPEAAQSIPGVWADLMTFSGGPRSCIGFRFALIEMKVIIFTLIRKFEFSLALPAEAIEIRSVALLSPYVRGKKGAQMPLVVKVCED